MTRSLAEIETWAMDEAPRISHSWRGSEGVGKFIQAACEFKVGPLPDVYQALLRSSILSRSSELAPPGAFHWWVADQGLVGLDLDGGGRKVLTVYYSASSQGIFSDTGIGYVSVQEFASIRPVQYLGWSMDINNEYVNPLWYY